MSTPEFEFEGTAEEVSRYAKAHPDCRFRLLVVKGGQRNKGFDKAVWDEVMAHIRTFKGKFPVLPNSAFSTDSLYD